MLILGQVNTVVTGLRTLEVEAIGVGHDLLHRRNLDLVGDWQLVGHI